MTPIIEEEERKERLHEITQNFTAIPLLQKQQENEVQRHSKL